MALSSMKPGEKDAFITDWELITMFLRSHGTIPITNTVVKKWKKDIARYKASVFVSKEKEW